MLCHGQNVSIARRLFQLIVFAILTAASAHAAVSARTITVVSHATALPSSAKIGEPVSFTAGASDSDGALLVYMWDFGDGVTATGSSTVHLYSAAGLYTVSLSVSNGTETTSETIPVNVDGTPDNAESASFQIQLMLLEMENLRDITAGSGSSLIGLNVANAATQFSDAVVSAHRLSDDLANPATAAVFGEKLKSAQAVVSSIVSSVESTQRKIAAFAQQPQPVAKELKPLRAVLKQLAKLDKTIVHYALVGGGVITSNNGFQKSGDAAKITISLPPNSAGASMLLVTDGAPGTNIATADFPASVTSSKYIVKMGPDKGIASVILYVGGKRWGGIRLLNTGPAGPAGALNSNIFDGQYNFVATVKQSFESFPFDFMIIGSAKVTNGSMDIISTSLPPIHTHIQADGKVDFSGTNLYNDKIHFKGTFTPEGAIAPAGVSDGSFYGTGHGNFMPASNTEGTTSGGTFSGSWTALKQK